MGFFDFILQPFQQAGQTVQQNVTQQQPTTPSGQTYVSQPSQPVQQAQPIQINPIQTFTSLVGGASNFVGGGMQNVVQGVTGFIQQPAAYIAPIMATAPVTIPMAAQISQIPGAVGGFVGGFIQPVSAMPQQNVVQQQPQSLPTPFRSTSPSQLPQTPSVFDSLANTVQTAARTTFSMLPGGIGMAIAADTAFSIARNEPKSVPFAAIFEPVKQPETTTEQYNTHLSAYNANLTSYNTDLATYQKGGSIDQVLYQNLQSRFAGLQTTKQQLDTEQKIATPSPTVFDQVGKVYEDLNTGLAPYTTDILGFGKALATTPDWQPTAQENVSQMYVEGTNFIKGTAIGATQHPIDIALTFAGGEALGIGENLARGGVARAAMSELPVLGTAGRAFSTPIAADIVTLGKVGLGAFIIGESGLNIVSQPTSTGKGEALGRTAIQFAGFGAGMSQIKPVEPNNYYAGRGFFSKQPEIGPIERAQFMAETTARSFMTEQPSAYREVATIVLPGRTIEPAIKAEPNFEILSRSGPYASDIKSTLIEQPHSVIGSSSVPQQYPEEIAARAGIRYGKDVDSLIESPKQALTTFARRTGMSEADAGSIMDMHPIPPNYAGLKPSIEADITPPESSVLNRLFGDPYRRIAFPRGTSEVIKPGKGYTGDLTYEAVQVQFGRKSSGVSLVIEDPIKYGFRSEKDIYDFVSEYNAQKLVALSRGTPESAFSKSDKAMESFLSREFTFGTVKGQVPGDENPVVTRSVREIYDTLFRQSQQDRAIIKAGGETPGKIVVTFGSRTPEKGIVSDIFRSVIPSGVWGSSAFLPSGSQVPSSLPSPGSVPASISPSPSAISRMIRSPPGSVISNIPSSLPPASPSISSAISDIPSSRSGIPSPLPSTVPSLFQSPSPGSPSPSSSVPPVPSRIPSPVLIPPSSPPSIPSITSIPPYSPSSSPPTPPRTPPFPVPTPIPPPPTGMGLPPGSGMVPFRRKRPAYFTETFNMGLDFSIRRPSKKKAKSYVSPKHPRKLKSGAKKK